MRKIMKLVLVALCVWSYSLTLVSSAKACINWCDPQCLAGYKNFDGTCSQWVTACGDYWPCPGGDEPAYGWSCDPGYYACNRWNAIPSGCCEMGSIGGTTDRPPLACDGSYMVNCPVGQTHTQEIVGTYCLSGAHATACSDGRQNYYVGTAQEVGGGCAEMPDPDDPYATIFGGVTINTYSCCPSGSTNSCSYTSSYTVAHTCYHPLDACSINDRYVSDVSDPSTGVCYVDEHNCVEQSNGDIDCEYDNVYNRRVTCQDYSCSCQLSCTAASNIVVTDGASVGTSVDVSWTPGIGTATQYFWIDEDEIEVTRGCPTAGDCEASLALTSLDGSESVTGLTAETTYFLRIASDTCNAVTQFTTPASEALITGKVYFDMTNTCDTTPLAGQTVRIDNTNPGVVTGADGAFSFVASLLATHSLAVAIPSNYTCSTGVGCNSCSKTGVVSPSANNYFYLTQNRDAWWQAEGAVIYTGGTAGTTIGSTIPDSLDPLDKYLVIPGTLGSSGVVLHTSATVPVLGAGGVNEEGWQARTTYKGKRTDYSYFKNEMGLLSTTPSLLNLDTVPSDGAAFHYMNGLANMNNTWAVGATESLVIFVNGDLDINADITVAPGGFVAFIVKGSITVSPDVTTIQGLFVADQNFNTTSNGTVDTQLSIEGSVVAWGDVSLARDLVANNSNSPAEKFVYRPDLLISMPDEMKSFVMQWSEVVPGTYDEQ